MSGKFIQLVPVQHSGSGPSAFYALDEDGWVWYGDLGVVIPSAGPEKISWRRLEHSRATQAWLGRSVMAPHERAKSVWYRIAGLLRRKDLAVDIIEAEIRSAQHEALLEAAKLVLDRRAG